MNDRIKELAEQATVIRKTFHGIEHIEFDKEKFAELIVRECAGAIIKDIRLNDVRSAANGCVRTIKQHFGVEE